MQITESQLRQLIREEIGAANFKVGDKVKVTPQGLRWYEKLVPTGQEHDEKTKVWRKTLKDKQGQAGTIDKIGEGQGIYKHVDVLYPDGDVVVAHVAMLELQPTSPKKRA